MGDGQDTPIPGARPRSAVTVVRQLACDLGRPRGHSRIAFGKRLSGAVTRALTLDFVEIFEDRTRCHDRQSITSVSRVDYRPRRNRLASRLQARAPKTAT